MNTKATTALLIAILQMTQSSPAKTNARPVYEVDEQKEEKKVNPGPVTFGNPLAGHSIQNAKLYAQNQQAMFNAERVRQHRAQVQRWMKSPPQDTYMKAYHESQESHQLAVEKAQADLKTPSRRQERRRKEKDTTEKTRSHRSHGSLDYQYVPRYKTVYVSPGPTYDQGVTIKPNGIAYVEAKENKLYTEAIPSKTQYYSKEYSPLQNFEASDVDTLNALLKQNPQEQLTNFNAMINENKENLETPLDLYFGNQFYNQAYTDYASYRPSTHDTRYKDHTPIEEHVDDIEDPNKHTTVKNYGVQPTTIIPEDNTITFYSTAGPTTQRIQDKPKFQALKYQKLFPVKNSKDSESGVYMHQHHTEQKGVQHLTDDGIEVSAYGDQDVSRHRRSILDSDPFITNTTAHFESNKTVSKTIDIPVAEELRRPLNLNQFTRVSDDFDYEFEVPSDYDDEDIDDYDSEFDIKQPSYLNMHDIKSPDLASSFSNKRHSSWNVSPYSPDINDFSTSYGVPYQIYNPEYSSKIESFPSYGLSSASKEPVYILTETQLKSLIGHHNLNIQHLDFYQGGKQKKHRPRRYRRRPHGHVPKKVRKNLFKLHKLTAI